MTEPQCDTTVRESVTGMPVVRSTFEVVSARLERVRLLDRFTFAVRAFLSLSTDSSHSIRSFVCKPAKPRSAWPEECHCLCLLGT